MTDNNGASDLDTVTITVNPAPPPPNVPPVANAGPDQTITLPVNTVTLSGTASSDADGNISSYSWTKISGPHIIYNCECIRFYYTGEYSYPGTYSFRLVVTDNSGATDDDTIVVTVNAAPPPPNIPPVANAGADQIITLPVSSVTLNGTASTDVDGTINSYAWSKISGPLSYSIANANAVSTLVSGLVAGNVFIQIGSN